MHPLVVPCLLLCLAGSALAAEPGLEVRTYPEARLYSHELDGRGRFRSGLLQNLAVVNHGATPLTVQRIDLELLREGEVLATQSVGPAELMRVAPAMAAQAQGGLLELLAFQFRPGVLLGKGVTLADSATLGDGQALLLTHRVFAWRAPADALRIRAHARDGNGAAVVAQRTLAVAEPATGTVYQFPLRGTWFVGAGASLHSGHRWVVMEEYALDLMQLGAGSRTFRGDGQALADYHAYGAEVRAAAAGTVVSVVNDVAETTATLRRPDEGADAYLQRVMAMQNDNLARGGKYISGNLVVLRHAQGEYSMYAHLKPGSVKVEPGASVAAGAVLGQLGHSGNSTEPHLHFQLCDTPEVLACAGLPVRFADVELPYADFPRELQSGDIVIAR